MCEFLDYLLNCVDNCYQVLKKEEPSRRNPIRLIQGKQKKMRCCACGQTQGSGKGMRESVKGARESVKDTRETQESVKDTHESVFQYSYINLTSMLCPVTDITFEVCESYVRFESPLDT